MEFILGPNVWPFKAAAVKLIIDEVWAARTVIEFYLAPNVGPFEAEKS
jgi:hypothetical protein